MVNKGRAGSGNETIARAAINSAMKHTQIDHMYIMWSGTDRYEMVTTDANIKGYHWQDDFNWYDHPHRNLNDDQHNYYIKHFLNIQQQYYRTLEHILRTQMFLDKKNIDYTMMLFHGGVLHFDNFHSKNEQMLHEQIDWSKFIFYNGYGGLYEFSKENFSDCYKDGDNHPPPIAHYYWTKDVMFKSDVECPQEQLDKLKNYFKDL
jgi:hypothetical protein